MDHQFNATANARQLKLLNMIDKNSCQCQAIRMGRRYKAEGAVAVLEKLSNLYPAKAFNRSDNGPEFIDHALRRW